MERMLRMAIERGHLAQVLFDEGAIGAGLVQTEPQLEKRLGRCRLGHRQTVTYLGSEAKWCWSRNLGRMWKYSNS